MDTYKGTIFSRNNGQVIGKGLTVPKWVLINQPNIPQIPQNLSAQAQKFDRLHWASIVYGIDEFRILC